jgi:lysophospholipase L1-like esterase
VISDTAPQATPDPLGVGRSSRRAFLKASPVAVAAVAGLATSGGLVSAAVEARPAAAAGSGSSGMTGRGIWVPSGWGQFAGPSLAAAAAGTGHANVALVGDSICRGFFSSNLDTAGWGGVLSTALRKTYGDGGSGFRTVADSAPWMSGVSGLSSPATIAFYQQAGNLITANGSWQAVTGNYLGPASVALKTSVATDTLVATVSGTTVKVLWLDGGAKAMGAFSYSIDGGTPVDVKPSGVYQIAVASTTGLASGSHRVIITATGAAATTQTVILGLAGENDTGCTVNQFSRYGQTGAVLNNGDELHAASWAGGYHYPADLFLYALAANDARSGTTGDAWAKNLRCWLEAVYDVGFGGSSIGAVDGILVLPHIGSYDSTDAAWVFQDYAVRARGIAEAYGLALIDLWAVGRNSWNWWKEQSGGSFWANADAPGTAGDDMIHLSDAGHQFVATTILSVISAALS